MPRTSRHCRSDASPPARYQRSFCNRMSSGGWTWIVRPGPTRTATRRSNCCWSSGVPPATNEIHLQLRGLMDQIRATAFANGSPKRTFVHVEVRFERREERRHVRLVEGDDRIDVDGRLRFPGKELARDPPIVCAIPRDSRTPETANAIARGSTGAVTADPARRCPVGLPREIRAERHDGQSQERLARRRVRVTVTDACSCEILDRLG